MKLAERPLLENPELEHAIAEDPYDEQRWIVLEDWLLEQNDPRAILVRLEKAGRIDGARRVLKRLYPQLLGPGHAEVAATLYRANWRAGYLREVHVGTPDPSPLQWLYFVPATTLLRALCLAIPAERTVWAINTLVNAVFAPTLHELTISNMHVKVPLVPTEMLALLPRLRRLALRGAYLEPPAEVPRITELVIAPTRYDVQHVEPMLRSARFPAATDVLVDLSYFAAPSLSRAVLMTLFEGQFAPALARVEIRGADAELARQVIDVLARSTVLPRLVAVNLGPSDAHMALRRDHGDRFDHVTVTAPADY